MSGTTAAWLRFTFLLAGALAARPQGASAQWRPPGPPTPRWVGHFTDLAGNATLGGLTAGVLQKLKGGSFKDGFVRGALGGAMSYAGKRVAARTFWGAGLLGREMNAVGVSVVRNASDRLPTFSRMFVPIGPLPLRLTVGLQGGVRVQPQLDAFGAGWLAWGLTRSEVKLDLGESLSGGALVFRADRRLLVDNDRVVLGVAASRSIVIADPMAFSGADDYHTSLAHERVHVLQEDFTITAWSQPASEAVLRPLPGGRFFTRYVAVDALDWLLGTLRGLVPPEDRDRFPTELEAEFLSGRR